ncbi:hypothetical protein XI06_00465 [Bradyrhizobium sp. CCBAU 11434]|nr:hypothetical protein [Bradyrhizobium sp. CCBAU 11434]
MIGSLSVSLPSVAAGGSEAINFSVANVNGTGATAAATTTKLYLSHDAFIDGSDTLIGTFSTPQLLANQSSSGSLTTTIPANLAPGTYYIVIGADTANVVTNEVSETNNVFAQSFTVTSVPQPDLVIGSLSVSSPSVAAGGSETINFSVANVNGTGAAAAATTTKLYLSQDAFIDGSDTLIGTFSTPQLLANQSSSGSLTTTIPANLAPGTYYVVIGADTANVVTNEVSETNNVFAQSFTVTPSRPDLSEYVSVANTTVAAGHSVTVDAYAMDIGAGPSGASTAGIYLSSDATITTSDTLLTTVSSGALTSVGQTGYYDHQSLSVMLPGNLAPGTYYLGGIADYNNHVSESNETNNTYNTVKITVTAPAQPDLSEYLGVANTTVAAGNNVSVDAYAMDIGAGPSGASTAGIYLSSDATITTSDTLLTTVSSGALTSVGLTGYYDHQSLSVMLPGNFAPGTYYLGGIADYNNQVSEINEANNTYNTVKITVTAPVQPDLSEYLSVANTTVAAGHNVTVDAYDMDIGNGPAGASIAGIYLSSDATITTSDTLLTTVNSGALTSVGQTGYYDHQTLSVMLPGNLAPGTYYLGGIADYNNQVSESNEANNTYNTVKITVTAPVQPDLSEYLGVANTTVAAGHSVTVDAYAMDIGAGPSGASTAGIYLSSDATITTSDTLLTTVNSGALTSVGQTGYYDHQTLSVMLSGNLTPGTYYLGGIADYNNQVSESNEANNTYNTVKITVGAPVQPDLSEYLGVANTTVAAGNSVTVDAYAMDIGAGPSGASTAGIYLSSDANITTSDTLLTTVSSGALTSVGLTGYYDHQTLSVTLPGNLAPGTYYLGGIADYNNQVSESNETNNTYNTVRITVGAPVSITLNDDNLWSSGALNVVNTFTSNGGTLTYYGPITASGFSITNVNRTDFAVTSLDKTFADNFNYFFHETHTLTVPAGGSVPTADTLLIQGQNGGLFSAQSIDLDTLFAAAGQIATFTGVKADNSTVTQTFSLDGGQGMQSFRFDTTFVGLKSLQFAPSMNEYFDNLVLTPPLLQSDYHLA